MPEILSFFVPMHPVAWASTCTGRGHGKRTTKTPQREAMDTIAAYGLLARQKAGMSVQHSAIALFISVHVHRLGAHRWDVQKPDSTNYQKLCEDALSGILWHDDAQNVHIVCSKAANSGLEGIGIMLRSVQNPPSKHVHFAQFVAFE